MTDRIDDLLNKLRVQPVDKDLSRLELAVWARIDGRGRVDVFGGRAWQVQLAVTCGALLLGVLVAQLAGVSMMMPEPLSSEIVVLSDDSAVAPSVLLEGGI